MRRALGGLIFVIGMVVLGIALGGWLLQLGALDPGRTEQSWGAVIVDDAIRAEIAAPIGSATAALLTTPPETVTAAVDANLLVDDPTDPLPDHTAALLADAHRRLVGDEEGAVRISGEMMAYAVRDQRAGDLPGATIDVERSTVLSTTADLMAVLVPVAAITGAVLALLALLIHDERLALVRPGAVAMFYLAAMMLVFGWLVPAYAAPLLDDSPWGDIPRLVTNDQRWWIVLLAILLVVIGVGTLLAQAAAGRRRRWSTPINTARYSEPQRWG